MSEHEDQLIIVIRCVCRLFITQSFNVTAIRSMVIDGDGGDGGDDGDGGQHVRCKSMNVKI